MMRDEQDKAIQDFNEAIGMDPYEPLTWNNRGNSRAFKEEYEKAILDFNEAIRLDPHVANFWKNRGNAHRDNDDIEGAISDFDKAPRLDPNDQVPLNVGRCAVTEESRTRQEVHNGRMNRRQIVSVPGTTVIMLMDRILTIQSGGFVGLL